MMSYGCADQGPDDSIPPFLPENLPGLLLPDNRTRQDGTDFLSPASNKRKFDDTDGAMQNGKNCHGDKKMRMSDRKIDLPLKPEEPLPSDCCGNGCSPCILDVYQEELALWEAECARIKNGTSKVDDKTTLHIQKLEKDHYHAFTITSITQESKDTLRFRFTLHPAQSLGLSIGQHIVVRAIKANGSPVTRQYTPVSQVHNKGFFELLLKIYPSGQMSQMIASWQVGDEIEMRGPLGTLGYIPNKYRRVLMLCAGTGIAPICQVIHAILDNENDETLVRLVYACKTYPEVLAKSELSEWRRYWNFSSVLVLSQEPEQPEYMYRYGEEVLKGRIDETFVSQELQTHAHHTLVLICGTRSFESDMLRYTKKLGLPEEALHKF